jgi:hypothetical protein
LATVLDHAPVAWHVRVGLPAQPGTHVPAVVSRDNVWGHVAELNVDAAQKSSMLVSIGGC